MVVREDTMWLKAILLMSYILLLFVLSRFLEALSWCEVGYGGIWSRQLMDPMALSVARLKALLEQRGVSYDHVVEKSELTSLVESSGQVTTAEADAATEEGTTVQTNFTSGAHFIEQVEDAKDSVWLVQIVLNRDQLHTVGDTRWKAIRKKVSKFGVHIGLFDCSLDLRYCDQKGWLSPFLLLALPSQFEKKASVAMHNYTGPVREAVVVHWLRDRLAERLEHIVDPITFETKWRDFSENSLEPEIRVVLFTHASCPPLFYSALSVKFPGRVRFGVVKLSSPSVAKSELWKNTLQKENIIRLPAYVVYTAEGYYQYGQNPGEYLSFPNMEGFLRFLYPCLNDIFIVSFCMANIFSLLEPATCNCGILKRLRKLIWCIFKYNIVVIMLWLPIIGIFQMPYLDNVPLALLKAERMFSTSYFGTIFRTDYTFYLNRPIYIYISFILYLVAVTALCKRYRESEDEPDDWFNFSQMPTLAHLGPNAFSDPMRSRRNDLLGNSDFFGSGNFWQPSYWMNPVISSDYIQHLPTWRYNPIPIAELAAKNATHMHSTLALDKSCSSNSQFVHTEKDGLESSQEKPSQSETSSCNCYFESLSTNALPHPQTSQASLSCHASLSQLPCKHCCLSCPSAGVTSHSSAKTDMVKCMFEFSSPQEALNPCSSKTQQTKENVQSNREVHAVSGETCICQQSQSHVHAADVAEIGCQSSKNINTTSTLECNPDPNVPISVNGSSRPSGFPPGYLESQQCVICLDDYVPLTMLCGLPCGHVFHERCIFSWLNRDKHFCPMCRWPSYKLPVTAASSI